MWPVVQFDFFLCVQYLQEFQLKSGCLALPPRRRWDLCGGKLHQLRRKPFYFRDVGGVTRRCCAQEFLWGLWHDFEMVGSGRSTLGSEIEKNLRDFDNLPSMFAIKLDCKLVQSLDS